MIGVLPMRRTKSKPCATAASEVLRPRMISTSSMRSTGEKKCRPRKSSCRCKYSARLVTGSVDVFDASSACGPISFSMRGSTSAFNARSSKTASMTRSHPARSEKEDDGRMRSRTWRLSFSVARPAMMARSRRSAAWRLARSAISASRSTSTTCMSGTGAHEGDAGAHETGADDADLFELPPARRPRDGGLPCSAPAGKRTASGSCCAIACRGAGS